MDAKCNTTNEQPDLKGFKQPGLSDKIHCEHEVPSSVLLEAGSSQYNSNDETNGWKMRRPSWTISFCKSMICSFFTTILSGVLVGIDATVVMWLDINLVDLCSDNNSTQQLILVYILRIRLTVQIFEGLFVQSWSFLVFLAVFGWPLMKELNLQNWNMLASFMDAIYRLFLHVFSKNYVIGKPYPLDAIFNGSRIASFYRHKVKERLFLAVKLGG